MPSRGPVPWLDGVGVHLPSRAPIPWVDGSPTPGRSYTDGRGGGGGKAHGRAGGTRGGGGHDGSHDGSLRRCCGDTRRMPDRPSAPVTATTADAFIDGRRRRERSVSAVSSTARPMLEPRNHWLCRSARPDGGSGSRRSGAPPTGRGKAPACAARLAGAGGMAHTGSTSASVWEASSVADADTSACRRPLASPATTEGDAPAETSDTV
ncbi:hypothetical protein CAUPRSCDRAFT_11391 [Caulochytrium protostelioides]|uniref:Uncharacterized protein n=1 Tax=Caulochytrium protostelioides TaxID=1555241 RepID=A0A4P9WWK7_9FUNG|nr:hypothetical protein CAUPRSCDRAFT_11391 [Caulochytrium protostelioides]